MVDLSRLTRKFVANPYEIVETIGEVLITVDQVLAQAKLNYDVSPFTSGQTFNTYILTPMSPATPTNYQEGTRIHFYIGKVNTLGQPTLIVGADTTPHPLTRANNTSFEAGELRPGFYSAIYSQSTESWRVDPLTFAETEWDYIYWLIRGCIRTAEIYMNIDLITKKYRTFRNDLTGDYENVCEINDLGGVVFMLRRGPVISVDSFTYTDDMGKTVVLDPTKDYYVAGEHIVLKNTYRNVQKRLRVAQIQFTSGMAEIPVDLYGALIEHISQAYNMHGLCEGDKCPAGLQIPGTARATYDLYRKLHIGE